MYVVGILFSTLFLKVVVIIYIFEAISFGLFQYLYCQDILYLRTCLSIIYMVFAHPVRSFETSSLSLMDRCTIRHTVIASLVMADIKK